MSLLTIHPENQPESAEIISDFKAIAERLEKLDVRFERWQADGEVPIDAGQEAILAAYAKPVQRLKDWYGFQSADVISLDCGHPQKDELRAKFLNEHTHSDFEVRFFVEGRGLFYLHPDENIYIVLFEKGDLISVPANVKHWFDMGEFPNLQCIRLFTTPEGWVANFTGDDIAGRFPTLEQFVEGYA